MYQPNSSSQDRDFQDDVSTTWEQEKNILSLKEYCPLREQENNMYQPNSSSQDRDFQDDVSTTSTQQTGSSTMTDSESQEDSDPWTPLIEEARQRSNTAFKEMKESLINSGFDGHSAKEKAFSNIMPNHQKELENIY